MLGQASYNRFPGLPKIGGFVNVRIAVVNQVEIDADVGSSRIEMRWLDAGNRAPWRHAPNVLRDVRPISTSILRVPDLPIISPGPNETLLQLGRSNCEYDFTVELA